MSKITDYAIETVLWIALVLAILAAVAPPAKAHDWYPPECCHQQDCAPVEKVELIPAGTYASMFGISPTGPMTMIVTTKHGSATVPPNMMRRPSQDHQMHACIQQSSMGKRVICIFIPPGS